MYERGLDWIEKVEEAIHMQGDRDQGAMIAITNAIQYQLEIGAHPETVRLLLEALTTFAPSREVHLNSLRIDSSPERTFRVLNPSNRGG
tara:strand:+ start:1555 stop:1821 length:267 start_codon:yes stop_codon:yes gene_type:complete